MGSIEVQQNTDSVSHLVPGIGSRVNNSLALAVRDSLAVIEERHKKVETARGGSGRAVSSKWTSRTGQLSRSFHRSWRKGDMAGNYGSVLKRSRVIEDGGTIRAKKTYLTIPTDNAPKGAGARDISGMFFFMSKKGNPLLATSNAGVLTVMFVLKRSVKLPARPALKRAIKATEKRREALMMKAIDQGIEG